MLIYSELYRHKHMMNVSQRYKDYTFKVIRSGDITEVYAYQDSLLKKNKVDKEQIEDIFSEKEEEKNELQTNVIKPVTQLKKSECEYFRRPSDIANARKKLKRLIYANLNQYEETDKFITLTFRGDAPTREKVVKEFINFRLRFKRKFGENFEYLAVIERGEKGTKRLHLHIVVFGMRYLKHSDLFDLWKNGRAEIKQVYKMNDVADYMTKYIRKTLEDGYVDKGQRFYFPSTKLKKPTVDYLNDDEMKDFIDQVDVGNQVYNFSFDSTYVGLCNYTRFKKS